MSAFKTIASLAVLAAGAAAAAVLAGRRKPAEPAAVEEKQETPAPAAAANLKEGVYSFIAGFGTTLTTEVKLSYDADKFSFAVVEDETLNDTNVSHVAILNSEKLDIQLEYAEFYPGEGYEEFCKAAAERYNDCETVLFGENSFLKYIDGDAVCLALPVSGNAECCIIVSLFKAKDNDDKLSAVLDYPEVRALLASVVSETAE